MTFPVAIGRAADLLVSARRSGKTLPGLEADLAPATIADAYAVQDATMDIIGPAGGWKVAPKPDGEPRCAILPVSSIHRSGDVVHVPAGGLEAEVETAFVFGRDFLDIGRPYDFAEVLDGISSMHLAFELLGSRFDDRRALPPLQPIADLQSNAGVILGPPIDGWLEMDLTKLDFHLSIDGEPKHAAQRHASLAQTIPTLTWLVSHAISRGRPITAGTVVITGARMGPVPIHNGLTVLAESPGLGAVAVNFNHANPAGN